MEASKGTFVINEFLRLEDFIRQYVLALYKDGVVYYVKVSPAQTKHVEMGCAFIGDIIEIILDSDNGIEFRVVNKACSDRYSISYGAIIYQRNKEDELKIPDMLRYKMIPFLSNIYPFSTLELKKKACSMITDKSLNLDIILVGKTRCSPILNPLSEKIYCKILLKSRFFHKEKSYNPFFFIIGESNGNYIKIVFWKEKYMYSVLKVNDFIAVLEYNLSNRNYKTPPHIEINSISEAMYYNIPEIKPFNVILLDYTNEKKIKSKFELIQGIVSYFSKIIRIPHENALTDAYLLVVDKKPVILYFNSDMEFYKISAGDYLKISELRKAKRANYEFYVSTAYTQFSIAEKMENPAGTYNPNENKRIKLCDDVYKPDAIDGAIGFLPDTFNNIEEIENFMGTDKVGAEICKIGDFLKPEILKLDEINEAKEKLIYKERRKYVINSKIFSIYHKERYIHYTNKDNDTLQGCYILELENNIKILLFANYFDECKFYLDGLRIDEIGTLEGKKAIIFIEMFHASPGVVLVYGTNILRQD